MHVASLVHGLSTRVNEKSKGGGEPDKIRNITDRVNLITCRRMNELTRALLRDYKVGSGNSECTSVYISSWSSISNATRHVGVKLQWQVLLGLATLRTKDS